MARNRPLTPEELEKLKLAREKANEVRRKIGAINRAKKEAERQKLDEEYQAVVNGKNKPNEEPPKAEPEPAEEEEEETKPKKQTRKTPAKKKPTKKVLYMDSESSSESSGEEYDITPIKERYKAKYQAKYGLAQQQPAQKPHNYINDAYTIARHNIQSKLDEEAKKLAYASLFG